MVAGRFGTDPLISLPAEKPPGGLVVRTLSEGPGPVVRPGDYVLFDVAAKVWTGDRLVLDTFASHQPQGLPLPAGLPAWRHLAGQRVGSRVLEVVPPKDGFGRRGDASVNVTGTDTLVFVFDILAAVPSAGHASGTAARYRPGGRLPQVMTGGEPANDHRQGHPRLRDRHPGRHPRLIPAHAAPTPPPPPPATSYHSKLALLCPVCPVWAHRSNDKRAWGGTITEVKLSRPLALSPHRPGLRHRRPAAGSPKPLTGRSG